MEQQQLLGLALLQVRVLYLVLGYLGVAIMSFYHSSTVATILLRKNVEVWITAPAHTARLKVNQQMTVRVVGDRI